ncbi:hypothetical protein ACQ4PT_052752 [Festuca glaucescens]
MSTSFHGDISFPLLSLPPPSPLHPSTSSSCRRQVVHLARPGLHLVGPMSTFSSEPGSTVPLQPVPMQTVHRTDSVEAPFDEDSDSDTDESPTNEYDPWEPPRPRPHPSLDQLTCPVQYMRKYMIQIRDFLADARATNIIVPDRTSEEAHIQFYHIYDRLSTVLQKDSVKLFLRIFEKYTDSLVCGFVITPQTLDLIIAQNALRCAKLVLEGKSPKLWGQRANPNYITSFGYFPLHQAAESFSVDMIELLFRHGASANQRTSGDRIVEGLLPLHVAIENTCQHKYLEDNLLADQNYWKGNVEYIYKLIHLLCLPEMKIFLDTTRLLATRTDDVVDELLNYIKQGKLVPAAILLLAAQRQFRNLNGFDMIKDRIEDHIVALGREGCRVESGKNTKAKKHLKEMKVHLINAVLLVKIILKAGEALDKYIQTHSEASHQEVLGKVSAILQNHEVGPTGKEFCIEDLNCCPYDCGPPNGLLHEHGDTDLTKAAIGSPIPEAAAKKAVAKKPHDSHWYARDQFFPLWRSVLTSQFITKVIPPYAPKKELPQYIRDADDHVPGSSQKKLIDERYSQIRLGMLERSYPRVTSHRKLPCNHQSRRLFGTAASTVLKMLKRV